MKLAWGLGRNWLADPELSSAKLFTGAPGTSVATLLRRDAEARQHLIEDPITALKEYLGSMPEGNYRVEVIPERPNTITILLPTPPVAGASSTSDIDAASRRIYDMLFRDGIGGYLIPDETLTWTLRDMRAQWAAAANHDEKLPA